MTSTHPDVVVVTAPRSSTQVPLRTLLLDHSSSQNHSQIDRSSTGNNGCEFRVTSSDSLELRASGQAKRERFDGLAAILTHSDGPVGIYKNAGGKAVAALVQGYNSAMVSITAEDAYAETLVWGAEKKGNAPAVTGVLGISLEGVFRELREKKERLAGKKKTKGAGFSFLVSISAVAYQGEKLTDLLAIAAANGGSNNTINDFKINNNDNNDYNGNDEFLSVENDLDDGPVVANAIVAEGINIDDLRAVLSSAARARQSLIRGPYASNKNAIDVSDASVSSSLFGNIASVVTITVTQHLDSAQRGRQTLKSRLSFFDLPDAAALALPPSRLSLMDGPLAHRGMIAFATLVKSLVPNTFKHASNDNNFSSEFGSGGVTNERLVGAYHDSLLTRLMHDALGGNSITSIIATVSPIDHARSLAVLRFASQCKRIPNHPVVNDDQTIRMLRRLRAEANSLRSTIDALKPDGGAIANGYGGSSSNNNGNRNMQTNGSSAVNDKGFAIEDPSSGELRLRIAHLMRSLAESESAKVEIDRAREKAVDRLAKVGAELDRAVRAKTVLQSSLVQSEESRLSLARALLDVDEENAKLTEEAETSLFTVTAERDALREEHTAAVNALEDMSSQLESFRYDAEREKRDFDEYRSRAEAAIEAARTKGGADGGEIERLQMEVVRLVGRTRTLEADLADANDRARTAAAMASNSSSPPKSNANNNAPASGPASGSRRDQEQMASMSAEVDRLRRRIRDLEGDLDLARRDDSKYEAERLAKRARELENELQHTREDAEIMRRDFTEAVERISAATAVKANSINSNGIDTNDHIHGANPPAAAVADAVEAVRTELERAHASAVRSLRGEIEHLRDAESRLRTDNADLRAQLATAKSSYTAAIRAAERQQQQQQQQQKNRHVDSHHHYGDEKDSSEILQLRSDLTSLRDQLHDRESQIQSLRSELQQKVSQLAFAQQGHGRGGKTADHSAESSSTGNAAAHSKFKERYAAEVREKLRWKAKARELEGTNRLLTEELRSRGTGMSQPPPPVVMRPSRSAGRDRGALFNPAPVHGWSDR